MQALRLALALMRPRMMGKSGLHFIFPAALAALAGPIQ